MRKFVLSLVTILTVGVFAGAAIACPYSGAKKDKEEVVIGS